MKCKKILFLLGVLAIASCTTNKLASSAISENNSSEQSEEIISSTISSDEQSEVSSSSQSEQMSSESSSSGPKKIIVPAHTLKDNNPPINVNSKGQTMDNNTWENFRNSPAVNFSGNYNYTYTTNSGGKMVEAFTKNGYYIESPYSTIYYERIRGSEFYSYSQGREGLLRSESSLDLQDKYTYRIHHEIYVHMFDFSEYQYNSSNGVYIYNGGAFTSKVKFQGGYLTYLYYSLGGMYFEINASFTTTINIPQSYYYEE